MFIRKLFTKLLKQTQNVLNLREMSSPASKVMSSTFGHKTCPQKTQNYTTIVCEGNIGSGKTTFLQHFNQMSESTVKQTEVLSEPIEKWRNVRGLNLFQLLCDDTKRWSFAFQSYVQLSMLELHQKQPISTDITIKLMERSLYSARFCFVENLFRNKLLKHEEYVILDEWFQYIVNNEHNVNVDLIIYLRTDPEVVYERILKRGRNEEKNITLDYLKSLHELHEEWLLNRSKFAIPAPVITIDANSNLEEVKRLYDTHSQNILNGNAIKELNICN